MVPDQQNDLNPGNESHGTGKSRIAAYLLLLGLSTVSALVILSLWMILWTYRGDGSLAIMVWIFGMMLGQWLLVIPATRVVFLTYKWLSRRNSWYEINAVNVVAIPFLFNILAASSFFIYIWLD